MRASLYVAAAAAIACTGSAAAATVHETTFDTDGDFGGYVDFSSRLASASVAGGVLAGTGGASNDPQLRSQGGAGNPFGSGVDLGALPDATLEVRAKNSTGGDIVAGVSWIEFSGATASNTTGLPTVNINWTPTAADTFEVFTVDVKALIASLSDITGAPSNDNILRSFRIDPINNAGSGVSGDTFEIDYIRITSTVPEPASAALAGLGALCLLRRRR